MADFKIGDNVIATYLGVPHRTRIVSLHENGVGRFARFEPKIGNVGALYFSHLAPDIPLSPVEQAAADYCKAILHGR